MPTTQRTATRHQRPRNAKNGVKRVQTPPMSEKSLQECVRRTALAFGWLFFHPFDSRRSTPGWPDCALVRGGATPRLVFCELKTSVGKLTAAQQAWLAALRDVPGIEVYIWKPANWFNGDIERILRGEARP